MGGGAEAVLVAGVETTGLLSGRAGSGAVEKVFAEVLLCGGPGRELEECGMS